MPDYLSASDRQTLEVAIECFTKVLDAEDALNTAENRLSRKFTRLPKEAYQEYVVRTMKMETERYSK